MHRASSVRVHGDADGGSPPRSLRSTHPLHLAPLDPLLYGIHGVRAQMLINQEEYDTAAAWADRAATTPGAHYLIAMIALIASGLAERHEQAARWRQTIRRLKPDTRSADYFAAFRRAKRRRGGIAAELRRQGF